MLVAGGLFVLAVVLASMQPHVSLPSQLWLAIPYALTIAAIAGVIVHVRQPSALTIPFVRGGSA
jgi:simple sugar transport system permease protein